MSPASTTQDAALGPGVPVLSFGSASEARDGPSGFGGYHDLYALAADVARADEDFHARVRIHRYPRMLVFERHLDGVIHTRGSDRVRRDGFDHLAIHLVLSGALYGGPPGGEHRVAPGEILLLDTSQTHRTRMVGAHTISLSVARDQIEGALPSLKPLHGAVVPAAAGLLADFMRAMCLRSATIPASSGDGAARAVSALLAGGIGHRRRHGHAGIEEALTQVRRERAEAFIELHLADAELDVRMVAEGIGVSRTVLYRLFTEDGGMMHYLQRRRLERMRTSLRRVAEARSVSALAYAHGFTSESHCSRSFRSVFGLPPGQYRDDLRRIRASGPPSGTPAAMLAEWSSELF